MRLPLQKKFKLTGFILFLLLVLAAGRIYAESRPDQIKNSAPDAGANISSFTKESVENFWTSAGCTVVSTGCIVNGEQVYDSGAFETTSNLAANLIVQPPVHTATYVADVIQNIRMPGAQPAYAQGIGFSALSPVLQIWKAFKNLSYFLFIIIFVVVGFMIMFRQKISSNAVATIQEMLPKIVLTLILITFSYAIAGFVVDLIYLSIFLFTGLFQQFGIFNPGGAETARNLIFGKNILSLGFSLLIGTEEVAGESAQAVTSIINEAFGGWAGLLSIITTPLAYLIIAVAIIIALFRTFFALVSAYISIIISTVFAPLSLLANVFPGSDSFKKWFLGLIANAAIFPATAIMIFLGAALVGGMSNTDKGDNIFPIQDNIGWWNATTAEGWVPPLIMGGTTAQTGANAVRAIIGLGVIMLLPEVIKMVHEFFAYKPPWYGEAALKNAQAGQAGLGRAIKAPFSLAMNTLVYGRHVAEGASIYRRYRAGKNAKERLDAFLPPEYGRAIKEPEAPVREINPNAPEPPVISEEDAT